MGISPGQEGSSEHSCSRWDVLSSLRKCFLEYSHIHVSIVPNNIFGNNVHVIPQYKIKRKEA